MSNKPPFSANGNGPVEAALADYLARVDRGEEVDLPALVSAYPGCSEEDLRTFIAQERNVCGAIAQCHSLWFFWWGFWLFRNVLLLHEFRGFGASRVSTSWRVAAFAAIRQLVVFGGQA